MMDWICLAIFIAYIKNQEVVNFKLSLMSVFFRTFVDFEPQSLRSLRTFEKTFLGNFGSKKCPHNRVKWNLKRVFNIFLENKNELKRKF